VQPLIAAIPHCQGEISSGCFHQLFGDAIWRKQHDRSCAPAIGVALVFAVSTTLARCGIVSVSVIFLERGDVPVGCFQFRYARLQRPVTR
jgi:hypothetical protein